MTTEAKPRSVKPLSEWTDSEVLAECRRNRDYWLTHASELRARYPVHWLAIYEGGTVAAFEHAKEFFDFLFQLDEVNRCCKFKVPPPSNPNVHRMSSAHYRIRR